MFNECREKQHNTHFCRLQSLTSFTLASYNYELWWPNDLTQITQWKFFGNRRRCIDPSDCRPFITRPKYQSSAFKADPLGHFNTTINCQREKSERVKEINVRLWTLLSNWIINWKRFIKSNEMQFFFSSSSHLEMFAQQKQFIITLNFDGRLGICSEAFSSWGVRGMIDHWASQPHINLVMEIWLQHRSVQFRCELRRLSLIAIDNMMIWPLKWKTIGLRHVLWNCLGNSLFILIFRRKGEQWTRY